MINDEPLKLHLGCGEKYLEGYVNIDFPDAEQRVIKTRADIFSSMKDLSYPENSVDEIRSHHLFEHFSRAEALKLLVRWRTWLKPNGLLIIETPDFSMSASFFLLAHSRRRKYQLSRHMLGSEEAGWATHKDFWDKEKFSYVFKQLGFKDIKVVSYWNGLAKHAEKIPKIGKKIVMLPAWMYVPLFNIIGNLLPESFYKKHGSHKMPNVLARGNKDMDLPFDEEYVVRNILSLYLAGREGDQMLDVWMEDYRKF
jgi:predicted SAM-dependent methyltransferase